MGNGEVYLRLEELLKTLLAQADGKHVHLLQHLQQEVDLEKSVFLCHLLEAHSRPSHQDHHRESAFTRGRHHNDQQECITKPSSPRSKSGVEEGNLTLLCSRSPSRSESPQRMKKKNKLDSATPPLSSSSDLLPEDLPEPCSSDEGSEKSSTSRCSEINMDDSDNSSKFNVIWVSPGGYFWYYTYTKSHGNLYFCDINFKFGTQLD
ncbi:hypothetical protein PO909_026678 [Leuciscus waleckii]